MKDSLEYKLGLLHLMYLLINSDNEITSRELGFLDKVKLMESIDDSIFNDFRSSLNNKTEQDVFQDGIDYINSCSISTKVRAFILLYRMALVDGAIHAKEVRLLLYSSKLSKMDISKIIEIATSPDFEYSKLESILNDSHV